MATGRGGGAGAGRDAGRQAQPAPRDGSLDEVGLPRLLHLLHRERLTGVLRLSLPNGLSEVYLDAGEPVAVELPADVDRLGQVLVASGLVDEDRVRRALSAPRAPGLRYGRLLVDGGLIDEGQLQSALRLQIRRRLHRLFFARGGTFTVDEEQHQRGGEARAGLRVPPHRAIWQGVRSAWDEARFGGAIRAVAYRLGERATPEALGAFGFNDEEVALLDLFARGAAPAADFAAGSPAGRALLYTLVVTDLVEPAAASRPGAPSPAIAPPGATPPPARPASPTDRATLPRVPAPRAASQAPVPPGGAPSARVPLHADAVARVLADKLGVVENEDHFQVLGVPRDADRDEIKAAYLAAARVYHPDRLTALGLASLRRDGERVFRRVSESYATLSDDGLRAAYLARLEARAPGQADANAPEADAQRVLAGEMAFMEGEVAFKRRDFKTAVARFAQAVEWNPHEGEAVALLSFSRVSAGETTLRSARSELDRAVTLSPRSARCRYYAALAAKEVGDTAAAIAGFEKAIALDPRLVEAGSELRLLRSRATMSQRAIKSPSSANLSPPGTPPKDEPSDPATRRGLLDRLKGK